jgi:hypothetical protein
MEPTSQAMQAKQVEGCFGDLDLLNSILTTAPGHQMLLSMEIRLCEEELAYKKSPEYSVVASSRELGDTDLQADISACEARSPELKALKSKIDSSFDTGAGDTVNLQSLPVDDWKKEAFLNVTTKLSKLQDRFETVAKFLGGDRTDQVMNELQNGKLFLRLSQGKIAITAKALELSLTSHDLAAELSKITRSKNAARRTQHGKSRFGRSAVDKSKR